MKRILLFSDGTGNSSAKAQKTNVWRLFQAVDLTTANQIAFYDDGVGSSANRYLALLGGVFGWGLKRNVIDIYKFVCRNYQNGDQISGFGFSRGAFTIRVLVGLIAYEGLVAYQSEEQLDRDARAAYRSYRSERFPSYSPIVIVLRWLRDKCLLGFNWLRDLPQYSSATNSKPDIHFLGLWDTVAAYEIPINALKRAVNVAIWPMLFADLALSTKVRRACHALSLDEARQTFHPLRWDEHAEAQMVAAGTVAPGRLKQVWFAGVHCNVGGGYPEDRLSYVPLHWIMNESAAQGIVLLPAAVNKIASEKSPYARIYDSRAGFNAFYRYAPRRIPVCKNTTGQVILPIIDSSVILRMVDGTDSYAPLALPASFCVMDPIGVLQPMPIPMHRPPLPPATLPVLTPLQLPAAVAQQAVYANAQATVAKGIHRGLIPALEIVADTIWWRRVTYLITLLFALSLAVFPAYDPAVPACAGNACATPIKDAAFISADAVQYAITAIKGLLPSISTRWTDAFGAHPDLFAVLAAGLLLSLNMSSVLKMRIADRLQMAWHRAFRSKYRAWCRCSATASRNATAFALAVVVVLLAVSATAFPQACEAQASKPFPCKYGITPTTMELAIAAVALAVLLCWRIYRLRKLKARYLPNTFALSIARKLRTNGVLVVWCRALTDHLIPWLVVALFLFVASSAINRAVFDATMATGYYCHARPANALAAMPNFQTSDFCWSSGVRLEKGASYQITLSTPGDWFDASGRADVGGFPSGSPIHIFAMPLKRYWFENWFKPIARIGESGDDEYVLEPLKPFAAHRYAGYAQTEQAHQFPITDSEAANATKEYPTPPDRLTLTSGITAKSSGELFLYVNDAVLAPPFNTTRFYPNNRGTAVVSVARVCPDGHTEPLSVQTKGGQPQRTCDPAASAKQ